MKFVGEAQTEANQIKNSTKSFPKESTTVCSVRFASQGYHAEQFSVKTNRANATQGSVFATFGFAGPDVVIWHRKWHGIDLKRLKKALL
jgi:hypothetical protein